jgi:hypothetical protein
MILVGIDPGAQGGIAVINEGMTFAFKMPDTVEGIAGYFSGLAIYNDPVILIESQHARPTITRKVNPETNQETIFAAAGANATWTFAQHYGEIRGVLAALKLRTEYIRPQDWQKILGIPKKAKTESKTQWKNRLKAKAQELFPAIKVTLATADALCIAEVCRRLYAGNQREKEIVQQDLWSDL